MMCSSSFEALIVKNIILMCLFSLTRRNFTTGFGIQNNAATYRPRSFMLVPRLSPAEFGSSSHSPCLSYYTHDDLMWQLGPSIEAPLWTKLLWKTTANQIKTFQNFNNETILIPKKSATLQAFLRNSTTGKPIAKFGITTESGPFCEELDETIQDIYNVRDNGVDGVAAIKYMFVEPQHRRQGLGSLALEVISQIHAWQNCRYTVLIADDDGSGKLIQWYKSYGFARAPKLDQVFGCVQNNINTSSGNESTESVLGVAMIAPTSFKLLDTKNNSSKSSSVYIHCE